MRAILLSLAAAALLAIPATTSGQSCGAAGASAYGCTNGCPLAKEANLHRAQGTEAARASESVRRIVAKRVIADLDRI